MHEKENQINIFNQSKLITNKKIILNKDIVISYLEELLKLEDLAKIKSRVYFIENSTQNLKSDTLGFLNISSNGGTIDLQYNYFHNELKQIIETLSIERTKYYISRLIKSISEIKEGKINDINLNRWKEYEDIITDSLWKLDKRDNSGAHIGSYWGNFIPQIPNQLLRRYTKKNDWVLDTFLGSGTTLIECKRLGRNGIGIELQNNVSELASKLILKENNGNNVRTEVINDDCLNVKYVDLMKGIGIKSVQFIIMHPPYHDIIKFSESEKDFSNAGSIDKFLEMFGKVVDETYPLLDKGRYFALVIGDKYSKGEWIPLGFYCMQEVLKRKYKLKSVIVKNFEETKGKMNQKELWRYRALVGGFYIFKHEYIFLFKK